MSEHVLARLEHVFGSKRGRVVYDETLQQLGMPALNGPGDERRFANVLIERGGLYEVIGRALKVRALLMGAPTGSTTPPRR